MKRKEKSRLPFFVARVPSAREARGLSTTKPGSRSPPARRLLLSLLSTLRSLSNNNHNNFCSHRHLSNNSLSMSPTSPLLSASSSVSSPLSLNVPNLSTLVCFELRLLSTLSQCPRPFWACLRSLRQSGERTRLLLVNVTGGRSHRCPGGLSA